MTYLILLIFSVYAQESDTEQENTLETGFVVQGEIQRPDLTILMAKAGATAVHKIKREIIAKLFGLFLIIIASRFLYDYFNL